MGVYGLWRLLDASGKPVPLETLEGKVLAIDVSIWIHQVLQGYQDRHGNPKPNAHLLGLFHRICKLLYYKIKPVFVFDGGVPMLKKNTIASRRKQKSLATSKAQKMKADLINNLIKHTAVKSVLNTENLDLEAGSSKISTNLHKKPPIHDMFKLPDLPDSSQTETYISENEYDSDSSVELSPRKQSKWIGNIHTVDVGSAEFKALPADVRYDILTDLKDTRKQSSWGRLHEMPKASHDFSGFQMKRLLKRRLVQESLESAEKEMGGKTLTLEELEKLLTEQGVNTKGRDTAYRIASDSKTRLIYISDKNAFMENCNSNNLDRKSSPADTHEKTEPIAGPSGTSIFNNINEYELNDDDNDNYENDSDIELINTNSSTPVVENMNEYELDSDWESDNPLNQSLPLAEKYFGKNAKKTSTNTNYEHPALTYMLEYSGLCQDEIINLIEQNKKEAIESNRKEKKLPSIQEHCENQSLENGKNISSNEDIPLNINEKNKKPEDIFEQISSQYYASNDATVSSVVRVDTTDSDSDDFVEINDVPIPDVHDRKTEVKDVIQITIRSDQKVENDIFADIFEAPITSSVLSTQHETENKEIVDNVLSEVSRNYNRTTLPTILEESPEKVDAALENSKVSKERHENDKEVVKNSEECNEVCNMVLGDTAVENVQASPGNSAANSVALPVDKEELLTLKAHLEDEQKDLAGSIGKLERQAIDITDQIRTEAQDLLKLFGIPYVVAPMEAEAQCAYLEEIKLTDGTITDDSDIWLFGGQCVYKNFFNNNKRVLRFQSCDIQHHFKLTRRQMIQLALLVGSDYTSGISGVGPVTALEILAAFPSEEDDLLDGLTKFCSWIKTGRSVSPGKTSLRHKLRNIQIEKGFPSQAVVQAYLFPSIDESKERFTWGKPNAVLLFDYVRQKFGWTKSKFDDVIGPVLKRIEEHKSQKGIDTFFKVQATPKSIESNLSKRVQRALFKISNENANEEHEDVVITEPQDKKCSKRKSTSEKPKVVKHVNIEQLDLPQIKSENPLTNTSSPCKKPPSVEEYIPQREKDKAHALKKKLHAIEVFRKSKQGLSKTRKVKRTVRKIKKEAELSESSSDS